MVYSDEMKARTIEVKMEEETEHHIARSQPNGFTLYVTYLTK